MGAVNDFSLPACNIPDQKVSLRYSGPLETQSLMPV